MAELGKRMAALQRDMQLLQTLARNQKALTEPDRGLANRAPGRPFA